MNTNGEVYGLVDKDQKKIYYDTTNTATSFPTTGRAGKEIVIRDNLLRLANEITSIEIQRNSAGETLEQWEDLQVIPRILSLMIHLTH